MTAEARRNTKPHGQLRQSQLINTFGPGAIVDLPKHSVIIAGLEDWMGVHQEIIEPRLSQKIRALLNQPNVKLMAPPPDTQDRQGPQTGARVFRFPEWFISKKVFIAAGGVKERHLVHRTMLNGEYFRDDSGEKIYVLPIRFVRACRKGHIGDINWYQFVHFDQGKPCEKAGKKLKIIEYGTSGDLMKVGVECECGKRRFMSDAADPSNLSLGYCGGDRPWLGARANERCNQPNRLLVRTSSNAYFPHMMGVISLPDKDENLSTAIRSVWHHLNIVEDENDFKVVTKQAQVREAVGGYSVQEVLQGIKDLKEGTTSVDKPIKQAELEVLLDSKIGSMADVPGGTFFARTSPSTYTKPWMSSIEKVVLVHRLREVVAQVGFTRFEADSADIDGELSGQVERAPLALNADWYPAVENKGEGFFIQFKKEAVESWLSRPQVFERGSRIDAGFAAWAAKRGVKDKAKFAGLPYIMLHSFSHLLITAVALECGYPSSSIRERIYAIPDVGYGVLLYTGSSDAEGTLGGLVEAGRNIEAHVESALRHGELCSNDPVCAQHRPDDTLEERLRLGAACHGCVLIAETSCERYNCDLDRALVVPTVEGLGAEFFPSVGD